ncbi:MAG: type II toxin-antitoxin system RelE/ParE family toxin [Planctomycetes bacterium]|nr:type II toxin-antitoxin system RelE/ParE family toxin [Planctomycetota bacterium]
MKRRIRFLGGFFRDVREQKLWYDLRSTQAGAKFKQEVDAAVRHIRDWPESCHVIRQDVRRKGLKNFPFTVVYFTDTKETVVVGVMHFAQDFGLWLKLRFGLEEE